MANSTRLSVQHSYNQCEVQSHIIWKKLRSEKVKCELVHQFYILCAPKHYSSYVTIPSRNNEKYKEKYEIAKKSISDPEMDILIHKKVHSWPRATTPVTALIVPRDGNSLCHSISVLICGVIDQNSFFRRCLNATCMGHLIHTSPLCHRWTEFITEIFQELGKDYNDQALRREWNQICLSSTSEPVKSSTRFRDFTTLYSPLQQFHIFVMAQVCRRVIVVASLEEGGFKPSIYLPVTIPADECIKVPLYIAHHKNHFAPLVLVQDSYPGSFIQDLCIPIVDHNLKTYEFPYLYYNENGPELLKKYARLTKFGYSTTHNFNEYDALRIPESDVRIVSGCVEAGVNPNAVIDLCYDGLSQSRQPSDVSTIWIRTCDLKDKFQEDLPPLTFLGADPQPLSIGMQPESDSDDSTHGETNAENETIQNEVIYSSNFSQDMNVETIPQTTGSKTCADCIKTSIERRDSSSEEEPCNDSVLSRERSVDTIERNSDTSQNRVLDGADDETNLKLFHSSKKRRKASKEDFSSTSKISNLKKLTRNDLEVDKSGASAFPLSPRIPDDQQSITSVPSVDGVSTGNFQVIKLSLSHVIVINPDKVSLFVSKLDLGKCSVLYRLEKKGLSKDDRSELSLPKKQNKISINFGRTNKNELEMELTEKDRNFFVSIVLPDSVTCDRSTLTTNAEPLVTVVEDIESPYFDFTNNPEKCRTAGCMNRAVKQYRNLCSSCNTSWMNMLKKSEEISSFSYYDSVSSIENRANDGSCKSRNCRREGVPELYGFCQQCFNAPGL